MPSPPGAGKTRLVVLLAATLAERAGLRVGIAAQTRPQAIEIGNRLGVLTDGVRLKWPTSAKADRPKLAGTAMAVSGPLASFPSSGGGVLVATTAGWLWSVPSTLGCDVMIVDEAWRKAGASATLARSTRW